MTSVIYYKVFLILKFYIVLILTCVNTKMYGSTNKLFEFEFEFEIILVRN